jgi:hypothetical protein
VSRTTSQWSESRQALLFGKFVSVWPPRSLTFSVISMKTLIRNPWVSWSVRTALILVVVLLIAGFSFLGGRVYAERRAAITLANDSCFIALSTLRARHDPAQRKLELLAEREVDFSGIRLAELSLRFPKLIERKHYNLLVRVRDYRTKYGRAFEADPDLNPAEVDRKIAEAITYLESIHNTNQWSVPTLDEIVDRVEKSEDRR